jgi:hypothetical protein
LNTAGGAGVADADGAPGAADAGAEGDAEVEADAEAAEAGATNAAGAVVREADVRVSCPETARPAGTRSAPTAATTAQVRILTRERSLTPATKTIVDVD